MAKKRKAITQKKVHRVISAAYPAPGWEFLKDLKCVQFTAFDNESAITIGAIHRKVRLSDVP